MNSATSTIARSRGNCVSSHILLLYAYRSLPILYKMNSTPSSTRVQLNQQLVNPSDILSLLLLVGGDVVQRAIAQLFGFYVESFRNKVYLTPVAFSFGWVGYAFTSLASVVGDKQLMPSQPDNPSKVINCDTGYARINRSWLLGRLLRDHEMNVEKDPGTEHKAIVASERWTSLRIDVFDVEDSGKPKIDWYWGLGWLTIAVQLGISIIPWTIWGDWAIFLITASGTALALITAGLRQWNAEKWPGRRLNKPGSDPSKSKSKAVFLTRGNGHRYVMMLHSSGTTWDLETLATATSDSKIETPWLLAGLAFLWTCLLITVSGLKANTWFLIGIGVLGMIQNIVAGAVKRDFGTLGLKLTLRSSNLAPGFDLPKSLDAADSKEDLADTTGRWQQRLTYDQVPGVRGAIRELEKEYPKAGFALMLEFFPALLKYEPERYRTNAEKKFWKKAYSHMKTL